MKKLILLFCLLRMMNSNAQPGLTFLVSSVSGYTITCEHQQINCTAFCVSGGTVAYSWVSSTFTGTGTPVSINQPGSYSVIATQGSLTAVQVFTVYLNVTPPVSSASSTFQVVSGTMAPQAFTFTALSPTANIYHYVYTPVGGTVVAGSQVYVYHPSGIGTYTHCIVNVENGCSSCRTFSVVQGAPATVGIDEFAEQEDLVFPNPGNGFFKLRSKVTDDFVIELYNSAGTLIRMMEMQKDETGIDISDQAKGLYYLRIRENSGSSRYVKLLKE